MGEIMKSSIKNLKRIEEETKSEKIYFVIV